MIQVRRVVLLLCIISSVSFGHEDDGMGSHEAHHSAMGHVDYDGGMANIDSDPMGSINDYLMYPVNNAENPKPENDFRELAQGNVAQGPNRGVVISPGAFEDYNENINPIYYDDNVDPENNNDFNYPVQPSSNLEDGSGFYQPVCDIETCKRSCFQHLGYTVSKGAMCYNNECYCKETADERDETTMKPPVKSTMDDGITKEKNEAIIEEWNYRNQDKWPEMFPKCGEPNSSPIEINLDTDGPFKRLNSTLKFLNYDANISLIVENSGHGVQLYVQGREIPEIEISTSPEYDDETVQQKEVFTLARIDLHWNSTEHRIISSKKDHDGAGPHMDHMAGPSFVMEAHLHHYNMRRYEGYDQAIDGEDGGTVTVAALFKLSHGMSHLGNGWNNIFSAVADVIEPGTMKLLDKDAYVKPFEEHLNVEYADYIGSETSPPCRHGVRWIVSYCPHGLAVTSFQIRQLQEIKDESGMFLRQNSRDAQNGP